MAELIYPTFDYKVKKIENKPYIFDVIRKKYIFITPEEWVRQHVIHWLILAHNYPKSLIKVESGLTYHQKSKRTDIEIYDRNGHIFLVVECKATTIKLSETTLQQALAYNSTLKSPYIMITNGLIHYLYKNENQQLELIKELPNL